MSTIAPLELQEWERSARLPSAIPFGRNGRPELSTSCNSRETPRLGVPRRGHVLSTVVEVYGKPIRNAVAILSESLTKEYCSAIRTSLLSPCYGHPPPDIVRSDAEMAAWAIVSIWVVGVAAKVLPDNVSLAEAEQWFFGGYAPNRSTKMALEDGIRKAETALRSEADATGYFELLPYVLDPHGPGSRLSVRRNPATRVAQTRKRAEGVFYTPADVADYMAEACLSALGPETLPTVFDPACGTGVFLRAALQEIQRRHPERNAFSLASECLFGSDIDPWPLDAAAFVMLADTWLNFVGQRGTPVEAWQRLRLNLACIDTLCIDPTAELSDVVDRKIQNGPSGAGRFSISRLFPALGHGPTVILGNPPYADLGIRSDFTELGRVYKTLGDPGPNAEIYLPFVEQMIRLTDPKICSGALVVPLSIACNVGRQFSATRELLSNTRGQWRFAFFDREPHALFGEDVKTRNAIVLWSRIPSDKASILATGPLRKWRGDDRAAMFKSLQFTVVDDNNIQAGIPKIDGAIQAAALRTLSRRWSRLEQVVRSIGRCHLFETPHADDRTVFVGPTAYNFLNVFLRPERDPIHSGQMLSEHPLHAVRCSSTRDALAVFAILSSHLAYWWWHTHGDGFHVSRRFLTELPFGLEAFTAPVRDLLADRGAELWSAINVNPVMSLNRGRTSLAYTPHGHDDIRRKIDQVLATLVELEGNFVDDLQQFTARTVAATLRKHGITEPEDTERT